MVCLQLIWLGVISVVPLGENIYGVVVYLEALLLALAIALRIRGIKAERAEAERQARESLLTELQTSRRAARLARDREWALGDLAEKGRLLLAAGHDSRQMLSALGHFANGLQRDLPPDRVKRAGRDIARLTTSLNEVLTTAIEGAYSGGIGDKLIALEQLRPAQICAPLKLIHGNEAHERGIELTFALTKQVLVTDRVLVGRIVSNFLSNALKATEQGRILVACRRGLTANRFQVWDTGSGMDQSALRHLMADASNVPHFDEATEGEGAGLMIAKNLAKRIGGNITAHTAPGRGSLFELLVPRPPTARPGVLIVWTGDASEQHLFTSATKRWLLDVHLVSSTRALSELAGKYPRASIFLDATLESQVLEELGESLASRTIVMTYDKSAQTRLAFVSHCRCVVYRPLTPPLVLAALGAVGGSGSDSQC
jgi:signal transduction histidine kinase